MRRGSHGCVNRVFECLFAHRPQAGDRTPAVGHDKIWSAPGGSFGLQKTMYGLRVSPRAWAEERDRELAALVVNIGGTDCKLVQSTADPAVWSVVEVESGNVVGYLLSCVDDFLTLG